MDQKKAKRVTPLRIISMILVGLLPLGLLLLGGVMLLGGAIFNLAQAWTFTLLPLLVLVLCGLTIFSRQKTTAKWGIVLLICVLAVPLFLFSSIAGRYELLQPTTGEELKAVYPDLWKDRFTHLFLPELEEIGEPEDLTLYEYFATQAIFFSQEVYTLIARYEPADYALQKQAVEERYAFQTEPLVYWEYSCEPAANMGGYHFRMIDAPEINYPKVLGFIATNDETCEIVYMSFTDDDLDWIDDLPEFLNEDCGWEHIR